MDANVVVASLIRPGGWTAQEFARDDVEWVAPSFLLEELDEHAAEYAEKAGCSAKEWGRRVRDLARRVRVVNVRDFAAPSSPLVQRAEQVDPDDAIYLDVLVSEAADLLWTRDTGLLDAFPGLAVSVVPRSDALGA